MWFRWRHRGTAQLEQLLVRARPLPDDVLVARLRELAGGAGRPHRRHLAAWGIAAVALTAGLLAAVLGFGAGTAARDAATGGVRSLTRAVDLSGTGNSQTRFLASTCTFENDHFEISNPGAQTAGRAFPVTVYAVADCAEGIGFSIDPGYSGPRMLTWEVTPCALNCPGTAPLYPTGPVTFVDGLASVSITLYGAQFLARLGVSDGTLSGDSGPFSVRA
jgi:hypothetical protein